MVARVVADYDGDVCLLREPAIIEAWLRRDPAVHLYELGDLDPFFWPYTTWYGLAAGNALSAIALLYSGTSLPVLLAMGREQDGAMNALLERLTAVLPVPFYAHLVPGVATNLARSHGLISHGTHVRMLLADRSSMNAIRAPEAVALGPGNADELAAFYATAYPDHWFDPRMLETGAYFAVRRAGMILSVAGVHVLSRSTGVAALGNVATAPHARGQGLASAVIAATCRALQDVPLVGLSVGLDNAPAIALYERLGFERVTTYEEYLVTSQHPAARQS